MKTRACHCFAFLLSGAALALAPNCATAQRAGQEEWEKRPRPAQEEPDEDRMKAGIRNRIERANHHDSLIRDSAAKISGYNILISFSERVSLAAIRDIVRLCACEILELQLTVGETQMAFSIDPARINDRSLEKELTDELISNLKRHIATADAERTAKEYGPRHMAHAAQTHAAMSAALARTQESGIRFNGILIRSDASGLERVRQAFQSSILAVEFSPKNIRAFAIPLEVYK